MDFWDRSFPDTGFVRPVDLPVVYKVTDFDHLAENYVWGADIHHRVDTLIGAPPPTRFNPTLLKSYSSPILAELFAPIHNPSGGVLWKCSAYSIDQSLDCIVGCSFIRTIDKIDCPVIGNMTRVLWGLIAVSKIYTDDNFSIWCKNWLTGAERTCTIDAITSAYCLARLKKIRFNKGMTGEAWAVYAAYLACMGTHYGISWDNDRSSVGRKFSCLAVAHAALAAHHLQIELDVSRCAEEAMSIRK